MGMTLTCLIQQTMEGPESRCQTSHACSQTQQPAGHPLTHPHIGHSEDSGRPPLGSPGRSQYVLRCSDRLRRRKTVWMRIRKRMSMMYHHLETLLRQVKDQNIDIYSIKVHGKKQSFFKDKIRSICMGQMWDTAATAFFCQLVSNVRETDIYMYSVCYIFTTKKTHSTEQLTCLMHRLSGWFYVF